MFDSINAALSGSKLAWGVAALVANVGSRFVIGELTPAQQGIMRHPALKRIVLFCMLFIPTRDVLLSAGLTVVASALMEGFLNEDSTYCVLPDCLRQQQRGLLATLPVALRAPLMGPSVALQRGINTLVPQEQDDELIEEFYR